MISMGSIVSSMWMYDGTSILKDELHNEAQHCLIGKQAPTSVVEMDDVSPVVSIRIYVCQSEVR